MAVRGILALVALLALPPFAPVSADPAALVRAEAAVAAGDWTAVEAAVADVDALEPAQEWQETDTRLMEIAKVAESAGEGEALAAVMGKVADLRALHLDAGDLLVAKTQAYVGEMLLAQGRWPEAETRLRLADSAFDGARPERASDHAAVLLLLADARDRTWQPAEAVAALLKADGLLARSDAPSDLAIRVAIRTAEAALRIGDYAAAVDVAGRGIVRLAATGEGSDLARLRLFAGEARLALGDHAAAEADLLAGLAAVGSSDPALKLRIVAAFADLVALAGDRARAAGTLAAALTSAEEDPRSDPAGIVMARSRLAGLLLEDDRPREALAAFQRVLDGIEGLGLDDTALMEARASVLTNISRTLVGLGAAAAARDAASRAYAGSILLDTAGDDRIATVLALAEALAACGEREGAEERFAEAAALTPIDGRMPRQTALVVARDAARFLATLAGRANDVAAALRPAVARFPSAQGATDGRANTGGETRAEIARLLVAALWRVGTPAPTLAPAHPSAEACPP